jgi:hypothetical protein
MIIIEAEATFARAQSRPQGLAAREGLRFERKVFSELRKALPDKGFLVERNPWFRYRKPDGTEHFCSPDILVTVREDGYIAIVEVKLSWVPNVLDKVRNLYCPVVQRALDVPTKGLVIVKNSGPGAPQANSRFMFALMSANPFLVWRGDGPIVL